MMKKKSERRLIMKIRTVTGAVMTAVFVVPCIFSEYIVYPIVIALLCAMAVFEMLRVLGLHKHAAVSLPAYLIGAAMPIGAYFADRLEGGHRDYYLIMALALVIYLVYLLALAVILRGGLKFSSVSGVFMTVAYITVSFTALTLLRYIEMGVFVFVIVFISSCVCDIFAYFTGYLFGKHKLIPEISPKKTVEGAIGGTAFAVGGLLLYVFIVDRVADGVSVNYLLAAVYGLVLAVVGQLGDLIASFIKREYGIKDYGRLLPGHGGVLDRFDSMLTISLALLLISAALPPIFS